MNSVRLVEAFDAMLYGATAEEIHALLGVANEALEENTRDLLNAFGYGDDNEGRDQPGLHNT